ncbi:MAG: hypothetical protein IH942_02200 [Acidobacteria bacterium]|nr:hypothetical protein [Acidobacteriota bacterium]
MAVRTKLGLKKSVLAAVNEPLKPGVTLEGSAVRFAETKTVGNTRPAR